MAGPLDRIEDLDRCAEDARHRCTVLAQGALQEVVRKPRDGRD
jgi:hypothetical protein